MIRIGIDTSVLIGLLDPKDKWHTTAVDLKRSLQNHHALVALFDCVLAEAISTIGRRLQEQRRPVEFSQAVVRLSADYPRDRILWILPDVPTLYTEIIGLVESSQGQFSFNDALIALSCRDRNIPYLASFDRDFDQISWLRRVAHPGDVESIASSENKP
jgi:predicted nucleic acid-binding protein